MDIYDGPGDGVRQDGISNCLLIFYQDLTSGTLSRLHLSSKSLPGVLEDMEVPDEPGGGVKFKKKIQKSEKIFLVQQLFTFSTALSAMICAMLALTHAMSAATRFF